MKHRLQDVIVDTAMSKVDMLGLSPTRAQLAALFLLFKQFDAENDVGLCVNLPVPGDPQTWFRHEATCALIGQRSTKTMDMATVSALLDELGDRVSEPWTKWTLSENGRTLLGEILDDLEELYGITWEDK